MERGPGIRIRYGLDERLRNTAVGLEEPVVRIVERAIERELAKLEKKNGGAFKKRRHEVKRGPAFRLQSAAEAAADKKAAEKRKKAKAKAAEKKKKTDAASARLKADRLEKQAKKARAEAKKAASAV